MAGNYIKLFWLITILLASCNNKISYSEYVTKELSKGIRNDSLIHGIRFGMTDKEFKSYCTGMNQEKIFMPNPSGTKVRLNIYKGFSSPVHLDFFPVLLENKPITKVKASIKYSAFSYYEKGHAIENLVKETIAYFEDGYGGNRFFTIPHENSIIKYMYVKIDGNRKILLKPSFDGQELQIEFEDLSEHL